MNYDRFLTRVWDKLEKKMLYQGDEFEIQVDGNVTCYKLLGINEQGIVFDCFTVDGDRCYWVSNFGDRFVPMQCTGLKDKNGKLIYEGDILRTPSKDDWDKINFASYEVFFYDNDSCDCHIGFRMDRVHYHGSVSGGWVPNFNPKKTSRMEILGNIHENEKLMEVKA